MTTRRSWTGGTPPPARRCTSRAASPTSPTWPASSSPSIGVDPALVDEAIADPSTHDDVRREHQRVVDAGGYGVPTLFFPDGQCLFGPVLVDPPTGDAALRLWDAVTAWTEFPHLYELQRPKSGADQAKITETFRPYVEARDWVSINRGTVVDLAPVGGDAPHRSASGN